MIKRVEKIIDVLTARDNNKQVDQFWAGVEETYEWLARQDGEERLKKWRETRKKDEKRPLR